MEFKEMNVGIIGCGLIGKRRAKYLGDSQLIMCADTVIEKASHLAQQFPGCVATTDWKAVIENPTVEIILIATVHAMLSDIALTAVNAGKHVLVEKPAACRAHELDAVIAAAEKKQVRVRVGFNHRYHRAIRKAKSLVDASELGELLFIRAVYGHGGRPGYNKEWRGNPSLAGGGELLDQGIHLIDLTRFFLGEISEVNGFTHTYFWDMPVEDNGFLLLKTSKKKAAQLHVSCTEWKNTFSFDLYGRNGKIAINGLGGHYGVERITLYKMHPHMGPPDTFIWEYPMEDDSWSLEFKEFITDIKHQRHPTAGLRDAQAALKIVEEVYRTNIAKLT